MTQNSSVDMTFDPATNKEATIINSSTSLIGPYITLYANDSSTTPGCFRITARLSDTNACTLYGKPDGTLTWNGVNLKVPTGTIIALAKSASTPSGYLFCSGAEVSKTTYADLYALIGNTYGTPTDSTKFKLPNLYNKVLWGGATSADSTYIAGTYNDAGLPNISGTITSRKTASTSPYAGGITGASGAFKFTSGAASGNSAGLSASGSTYGVDTANFAASNSNSIYGASSTVRPPSLNVLFYIKY
jgi:microcystin-dependent protein